MTEVVVITLFSSGLALMVPVLLAALGEAVSEQAGVLNVGIEGTMLFGAAICALVGVNTSSVALSLLAGTATGAGAGVVLSALYVRRGTDQIVTGLLFNIFALGLTGILVSQVIIGNIAPTLSPWTVPLLGRIPKLRDVLNEQNFLFWISILLAVVIFYLLRRSWWGLYVRAAGERPHASSSAGLDVWRLRYAAVIAGNALAGLGGAALVVGTSGRFIPGFTSGRGFIALGVVVVARWNPLAVVAVAGLFGLSQALQFVAGLVSFFDPVPDQFWLALPYIVTVAAVAVSRGSRDPAAVGIPWREPAAEARS
ncbi:MAG: ABC transporter permease [bacterium]|nr:ABC transporter permease [bacterium]